MKSYLSWKNEHGYTNTTDYLFEELDYALEELEQIEK